MSSAFAVFKTAASQLKMKYTKIHSANNKLAIIIIIIIIIIIQYSQVQSTETRADEPIS